MFTQGPGLSRQTTSKVLLLLNGEGTQGGTTFVDSSIWANTVTANSSTTTSNALGVVEGSRAINVSGTGLTKGVEVAATSRHNVGTGPWTIECFATSAADTGVPRDLFRFRDAINNREVRFYLDTWPGGDEFFYVFQHTDASESARSGGKLLVANGTQHLCLMRDGAFCGFFIGGVLVDTFSSVLVGSSFDFSSVMWIGGQRGFDGAIDQFRLTSKALYPTTGFTPPTPPLSAFVF